MNLPLLESKQLEVCSMALLIYEVMEELLKHFEIDVIIEVEAISKGKYKNREKLSLEEFRKKKVPTPFADEENISQAVVVFASKNNSRSRGSVSDDTKSLIFDKKSDKRSVKKRRTINDKFIKPEITRQLQKKRSILEPSDFAIRPEEISPVGLRNNSVYCFMNASLQCLLSIPELNSYLRTESFKKEKRSKLKQNGCEALSSFIAAYSERSDYLERFAPIYTLCHSFLSPNTQHDAQVTG